ncbi:MAG: amidohydrolase family protein [Bacteroidia bacterium]|nr:amidohydrolase family protein [Bacteroidia bacterium]
MKNILPILCLLFLISSCDFGPKKQEVKLDYNIYFGDRLAGKQEIWKDEQGFQRYVFEFNDRGRGPRYEEKIKVDENGIKIFHEIIGHNYLKDTVYEVFDVKEGKASWESGSEDGSMNFSGEAHYANMDGSIGAYEVLVNALSNASDQSMPLLPSGQAKLSSLTSYTIGNRELSLAEINGFSFTPSYYWMDENMRFFATVSSWFTCIRVGEEGMKEELQKIQEEKEAGYLKGLASELTVKPEKGILIENVKLFDANSGQLIPNKNVIIEGNKITQISNYGGATPKDLEVISGDELTLFPGMFDMHTHISNTDGIMHLAAGVTSVRDMANSFDLPDLKAEFESNELIGPRIVVMAGFVDQAGPYAGPTGKIVESLEEGLEGIQFYKDRGYQQIKLYSSIDPAWVKELTKKAHELGLRISGHIPAFMTAEQAVRDGYDEIQHVNMLALNFLSDTIDTRTPLRFSMIAENTHALDTEGTEFKNFVKLLMDKNIVVDPTVSIFEGMLTTKSGEPDPSFEVILDRLPVQVKRGYYSGGLPIPEGKDAQYKASYQKLLDIVRELFYNNVTIVPGTDAMAGFGLHRELENYVRAGIPEWEVMRIATIVSAEVCGKKEELGSIEEGKMADMFLIDGNPLENISDIRKVVLTIKDGLIYKPDQLYKSIGVKP